MTTKQFERVKVVERVSAKGLRELVAPFEAMPPTESFAAAKPRPGDRKEVTVYKKRLIYKRDDAREEQELQAKTMYRRAVWSGILAAALVIFGLVGKFVSAKVLVGLGYASAAAIVHTLAVWSFPLVIPAILLTFAFAALGDARKPPYRHPLRTEEEKETTIE
ncbi:MAG: hypothetical protein AAB573_00395 [Patescibacteria group bacterium]